MKTLHPTDIDLVQASKNVNDYVKSLINHGSFLNSDPEIKLVSATRRNSEAYIAIKSKDLAIGMVPRVFKTLVIDEFGSSATSETEGGTKNLWWLNIHYSYTHFTGGSNGCEIANVYLNTAGDIVLNRTSIE